MAKAIALTGRRGLTFSQTFTKSCKYGSRLNQQSQHEHCLGSDVPDFTLLLDFFKSGRRRGRYTCDSMEVFGGVGVGALQIR